MSDWSAQLVSAWAAAGVIGTAGLGSPVAEVVTASANAFNTSSAWAGANLALYAPVMVPVPVTVFGFGWFNGATVSGNVDAGIYDGEGKQLVHTGSTAQATISTLQTVSVASTLIPAGLVFLALAMDNTTGTQLNNALTSQALRAVGMAQQATAFPLPSSATFAAMSTSRCPNMMAFCNSSVF